MLILEEYRLTSDKTLEMLDSIYNKNKGAVKFDQWSTKDLLAHFNGWLKIGIKVLDAKLNREEPLWIEDIDLYNKKIVEDSKNVSYEDLRELYINNSKLLEDLYSMFQDKDILLWADHKYTVKSYFQMNIDHHQNEHWPDIRKILNE
jgi:hypothetical protein